MEPVRSRSSYRLPLHVRRVNVARKSKPTTPRGIKTFNVSHGRNQRFPSHDDSNRGCQELPTQRTRGYRVGKLRSQVFKSARWQLVPGDRSADAVDLVQRPTTCIQSINGSSGQTGEGDEATYSQGGLRVGRAGRWLRARIPASSWDRRISTRMLPR